jgi:hypothetical protein
MARGTACILSLRFNPSLFLDPAAAFYKSRDRGKLFKRFYENHLSSLTGVRGGFGLRLRHDAADANPDDGHSRLRRQGTHLNILVPIGPGGVKR